MSLRFLCIEVRRNLRCANVFLQFDQSLTETEFLKINVDEDALRLREYSTETRADVSQHFTIEARTMSNLKVEECNASFRLTIDNIKTNDGEEESTQTNQNAANALLHAQPQLKEGAAASLHCRNCEYNLTAATQHFQRIREFPSGTIDISEFFCHHGPDFGAVLVPQPCDLFYGFQFIVLNREQLLLTTTKEKEGHLYCRRCLQYLGEVFFDGKAAKLWADTLQMKSTPSPSEYHEIFNTALVTPTCQLMHKIIRESVTTVGSAEPLLHQLHYSKVLLEASFPSRQRKFLLLHILEKHLQVLRNTQPLAHGSHSNNNVLQVQLEPCQSFKLLYRLMDERSAAEDGDDNAENAQNQTTAAGAAKAGGSVPPLLAYWQQDITIQLLKVSPTLFSALLEELECNSLLLPELYRYTRDDFQLSYVFYK